MLNQPVAAGVRGFYIASPGHVLVEIDYSQAELRTLGSYITQGMTQGEALKSFFVQTYQAGKDVHEETATILFGEDWRADPYQNRILAKNFNFGLIYGQSIAGASQFHNISKREAKAMFDRYFERMPEAIEYIHGGTCLLVLLED